MNGENNGKPFFKMDALGGFNPLFSETTTHPFCLKDKEPSPIAGP